MVMRQVELFASAARTSGTNTLGTPAVVPFKFGVFLLNVTAAATVVGDTLSVYLDVLLPTAAGDSWMNAARFTTVVGNGGAKKYAVVIDPTTPGTSVFDVSADASAGAQRPYLYGAAVRGRYSIVSSSAPSFTFSLYGNIYAPD